MNGAPEGLWWRGRRTGDSRSFPFGFAQGQDDKRKEKGKGRGRLPQFLRSGLVDQVEFFAGFEADGFAWGYGDFGPGAGVAPNAGFAGFYREDAETAQLDTVALSESGLHGVEDHVNSGFRLGARESCTFDHSLNQILLDHGGCFPFPRAQPGTANTAMEDNAFFDGRKVSFRCQRFTAVCGTL